MSPQDHAPAGPPSRFAPPVPAPFPESLPWYRALVAYRTNVIPTWPASAYRERVRVSSFLGRHWYLLNDPDAIRHVLVDNPGNYRRTRATIRILRPIIGDGLFLSDGDDWKHQRRTLAPAFAPRTLPLLARHVAAATEDAVASLARAAAAPVDLFGAMQHLALEIAGRSMFSLELDDEGAVLRAGLTRYAETLGRPYLFDLLLPTAVPTWHDLRRALFGRPWRRNLERLIARRAAAPAADGPRDLFDLLVAARDPEGGAAFTPDQLRDQVATMLVAGHETTAVALFWALYLLAAAPDAQARVAAEAAALALDPDHAAAALPHLVYTRAVISEALRLYPPAFTMVRESIGADRAGPADIPPRTVVMLAPWVLHRHQALWRDPDVFDPSRFLPGAPAPDRFAYLPFGVGPRVCIGAQFALTEATLALAGLVRAFHLALADDQPVLPVGVVTTRPDRPVPFRLTPR